MTNIPCLRRMRERTQANDTAEGGDCRLMAPCPCLWREMLGLSLRLLYAPFTAVLPWHPADLRVAITCERAVSGDSYVPFAHKEIHTSDGVLGSTGPHNDVKCSKTYTCRLPDVFRYPWGHQNLPVCSMAPTCFQCLFCQKTGFRVAAARIPILWRTHACNRGWIS